MEKQIKAGDTVRLTGGTIAITGEVTTANFNRKVLCLAGPDGKTFFGLDWLELNGFEIERLVDGTPTGVNRAVKSTEIDRLIPEILA